MTWMKITLKRLKSKSPSYFINLRRFCLWYASAGTATLAAHSMFSLPTPPFILTIIGYSIVGATFLGFGASLSTTDIDLSKK